MISLLQKKNYNFLINNTTGRWCGFLSQHFLKNEKNINNISKQEFVNTFKINLPEQELRKIYDIISANIELKNNLLTKLNYLVLHTSDACNMKCKYCYATDNISYCNSNLISSKTMIDAIELFKTDDNFTVLFHGREPLTNYKNIIQTVKHYHNSNIKFILQTNGLLLDESKLATLESLGVNISVSIDGFTNSQNQLRINHYTKNYTKKIKALLKTHPSISTILILHKKNIKGIISIKNKLQKLKQTGSAFNLLWPTGENPKLEKYVINTKILFKQMKKLFLSCINNSNSEFNFKERDLYLLYGRIVNRHINNYMCNKSPCGAGKVCICVDNKGDCYPCTTVNGQTENFMGNIYKNSKREILEHDYILKHRNISKIQNCKNCPLSIFCGGGSCPGLLYNYKNLINFKSIYCNYYKNMILWIMELCVNSSKRIFINS